MPVRCPARANKPYRPANGTEGALFEQEWCERCVYEFVYEESCSIMMRALVFDVDEEDYPPEWKFNANGEPVCTAFRRKPTEVPPVHPDQPTMF